LHRNRFAIASHSNLKSDRNRIAIVSQSYCNRIAFAIVSQSHRCRRGVALSEDWSYRVGGGWASLLIVYGQPVSASCKDGLLEGSTWRELTRSIFPFQVNYVGSFKFHVELACELEGPYDLQAARLHKTGLQANSYLIFNRIWKLKLCPKAD
jgi:hypothetical protein